MVIITHDEPKHHISPYACEQYWGFNSKSMFPRTVGALYWIPGTYTGPQIFLLACMPTPFQQNQNNRFEENLPNQNNRTEALTNENNPGETLPNPNNSIGTLPSQYNPIEMLPNQSNAIETLPSQFYNPIYTLANQNNRLPQFTGVLCG